MLRSGPTGTRRRKSALRSALPAGIVHLEHIGSTAVPVPDAKRSLPGSPNLPSPYCQSDSSRSGSRVKVSPKWRVVTDVR
jgi:hypothetical protein